MTWAVTGPVGASGPTGARGKVGAQGPVGPAGADGPQGLEGAAGPTGPQGEVGPTGPRGITGTNGEQGVPGPVGPLGPQGLIGLTGLQGQMGPTGPAGLAGERGQKGDAGTQGVAGTSAYDLAVSGGYIGSSSDWLASLIGPQGAQGPAGAIGPQGAQGPAGSINVTDGNGQTVGGFLTFPDDGVALREIDGYLVRYSASNGRPQPTPWLSEVRWTEPNCAGTPYASRAKWAEAFNFYLWTTPSTQEVSIVGNTAFRLTDGWTIESNNESFEYNSEQFRSNELSNPLGRCVNTGGSLVGNGFRVETVNISANILSGPLHFSAS